MGIRGLKSYILETGRISKHCDYREEIAKWRLEHGNIPTIIIDLKEFTNAIQFACRSTLCNGGNFEKYTNVATRFLAGLKEANADLIFFHKKTLYEDLIGMKATMCEITHGQWRDKKLPRTNKRQLSNLALVAKKYGELVYVSEGDDHSVVKYANAHADKVLAIIGNDTYYLVHDAQYQYWPVDGSDNRHGYIPLYGRQFDRSSLLAETGMSNEQIRLLVVLSDIFGVWSKFPPNSRGNRLLNETRFELRYWIDYVKTQHLNDEHSFDWEHIAGDLFGDIMSAAHVQEVEEQYNRFDLNYQSPDKGNDRRVGASQQFGEVLDFFITNHIYIHNWLVDCDQKIYFLKDLCWFYKHDTTANIEFVDAVFSIIAKFPGIFYKDEDEERRPTTWQLFNPLICGDSEIETRDIIYPPDSEVTLKQLIIDEDNREYDEQRWDLMKWTMGFDGDVLSAIRTTPSAGKIRIVALALHFLLKNNLICSKSAKAILSTEINARSDAAIPPHQRRPSINVRAEKPIGFEQLHVQEAHKYTIVYWLICRALEMCGLGNEVDLITFNSFEFYLANPNSNRREDIIVDILFPSDGPI